MLTGTCLCGACTWRFAGDASRATACDCSACRRFGAIWVYGHKDEDVHVNGPTVDFVRADLEKTYLSFDHCATCGGLLAWTALMPGKEHGKFRQAVNLRLADDPVAVASIPVSHHEGAANFGHSTLRGTVADLWF